MLTTSVEPTNFEKKKKGLGPWNRKRWDSRLHQPRRDITPLHFRPHCRRLSCTGSHVSTRFWQRRRMCSIRDTPLHWFWSFSSPFGPIGSPTALQERDAKWVDYHKLVGSWSIYVKVLFWEICRGGRCYSLSSFLLCFLKVTDYIARTSSAIYSFDF